MKRTPARVPRMRVLRVQRGLSQMETARILGVGHNRYWKIENGFTDPTDDERRVLAQVFGVKQSDLLEGAA